MKAKFLWAGEFLNLFLAFRVLYLGGRFGGGKTSLAVLLSAWLFSNQYVKHVVSNIPISFSEPVFVPLVDTAIILDESWIYLPNRRRVRDYAAFVRKFNHYLLLPSVWPPHSQLTFFSVQRVFNAFTVGLPFWFYRWNMTMRAIRERGYFAVLYPQSAFPHYDSLQIPSDDGGISDAMALTARQRGFKIDYRVHDGGFLEDAVSDIEDTASTVSESFYEIERTFRRRR